METADHRDSQNEIDRALARAVVARFLARALDPGGGPRPAEPDRAGLEALRAAAAVVDGAGGEAVSRSVEGLAEGSPPAPGSRRRLFGHTLRGAVCPYETEYGHGALVRQAHDLADLAGFYEAFGLRVARAHRERPDHVACQLEFLDVLSLKEARALATGDGEMLEVTRRAIGVFLDRHLGRFGRAFAVSLQRADDAGYYGRVGSLCEAYLGAECRHFEVPLGPAMLELRSTRDEAVPMACGGTEELVQIGDHPKPQF